MATHVAISKSLATKGAFLFLFLLISLLQVSSGQHSDSSDTKACGTLYSEPGAQGNAFSLLDQDQSSNLYEDQRASEVGWNATGSIIIENRCKMQVCNETYFDGVCHTLGNGTHSLNETDFFTEIGSVECTCAKQCKCSDVHIKKTTCGRAYLEGGCSTCRTSYTDLSVAESVIFPTEFEENVKAIRLRKGCTLTLYSDEDFQGEEKIIDQEIVEDFDGTIGSYICECDDSLYVPRKAPPRPESYPPLINIPDSMDDVIKMLGTEEYRNHPGLLAARRSYRNGRSHRNAYILLIGSTGAGKSSAINLLFDNPNVTRVGDMQSTTSDIHEFRIPIPIDELGIANSELRVIDTPGLGDTRGLGQDAMFLATLDNYLSGHEELKHRKPNVVLIFHKFSDNRFAGVGSSFVKMIRGLDIFSKNFADESFSNVIFVFSHFLSVSRQIKRRPEARLKQFKEVIQDYTLYPRPTHLVVAENKAKDQEVPMVNGYFKLPNNEYYPRNLFEKLELVTQKGGDTVGLGVFRTAFRDSEYFNVSSSTFKLVASNSGKVEKYLGVLTGADVGVQDNTEVSQVLNDVWDSQINSTLRKKFPMSLAYLKKALNLRNINNMQDVPRTTPEILTLLTALKHDEATRTLLEKGLHIKSPEFPVNTIAGYSYNVFKDMPLTTSPFNLGDLQQSDIGFMIPKSLSCKLEPETKEFFETFANKKLYLQHRIKSLGIAGNIPAEQFTDDIKPGCNIEELSYRNDSCSISATKDFRTFEFILNDRLDLTPEFQKTVKALPPFNESDHTVVDQWKNFFNTYGTHVVKSVHGGGAIQIQLESNEPFNQKFADAIFSMVQFAEHMTYALDDSDDADNSNKTVLSEGTTQTMKFIGGNPEFHSGDLGKMSVTEASTLLSNWKKSLKFSPAVLTTEMQLLPISQIVKKLGQNYTEEMERATLLLFDSKIVYTPPVTKKHQGPAASRDDTPVVQEMLRMIQESNERFQNLTLKMKEAEHEAEVRRLKLESERREWELKQSIIDAQHKEAQANAERKAEKERWEWEQKVKAEKDAHDKKLAQIAHNMEVERQRAEYEAKMREIEFRNTLATVRPAVHHTPRKCLKAGTKILTVKGERLVETLKVGDMILDKDLQPTTVQGITYEYLLNQKFYGFEEGSYFFTDNHLFVGPYLEKGEFEKGPSEQEMSLYAVSTYDLYLNNPLMVYLNVTEMSGADNIKLYQVNKAADNNEMTVSSGYIKGIFEDPESYPEDSLMYDLQVDSPSGTYIANGYVCKHELPPVEKWPNTMSIMFTLMSTPTFKNLPQIPYTVENAVKLQEIAEIIADMVKLFLAKRVPLLQSDNENQNGESVLITLENVNVEECIARIFSHPVISTTGVYLYSRVGLVIAGYMDSVNNNGEYNLTESQVAVLQHELLDFIDNRLKEGLSILL